MQQPRGQVVCLCKKDTHSKILPLYLVVMYYPLSHRFVQHLLVPLLKALGLWYLLIDRVTVEDVVVPFAGWAGPDVASGVAEDMRH